jgi:hypothetical protein
MWTIPLALGRWAVSAWRWVTSSGHWKIVAVAITAILLALLIHSYRSRGAHITELTADLEVSRGEVLLLRQAREADTTVVVENTAAKSAIARTESIASAKTEAALAAHPDWASQPIPRDILDSLRD